MNTNDQGNNCNQEANRTPDPVAIELLQSRNELLDLSLRNTLINFRHLKSKGAQVVDELSSEVFKILVHDEKSMSFLHSELPEKNNSGGTLFQVELFEQPEEENGVAKRHQDTKLQTPYSSERLHRRLLNTYYTARTSIEEQGVNILYLALGFLHWFEADSSSEERISPLILVPVEISRKNIESRFQISYQGDEIGTNLSLQEKLKSEFGADLPEIPDEGDFEISEYFESVQECINKLAYWRVEENEIALGFFSFTKFLMYKDLDLNSWPEDAKPTDHDVLRDLLYERFEETPDFENTDSNLDEILNPEDIYHVLDADSSQTDAIIAVDRGLNLVIQGPPGTGKSQTIANLIADAVKKNKKVLFVSEKMAALEVVKRRMDNLQLGDFCLELHSNKTRKRLVIEELKRVHQLGPPKVAQYGQIAADLKKYRNQLNEYCTQANSAIGKSGCTPVEAFGRVASLKGRLPENMYPLKIDEILEWDETEFKKREDIVEGLERTLTKIGIPEKHPFWQSGIRSFLPSDRKAATKQLQETQNSLDELVESLKQLISFCVLPKPNTFDGTEKTIRSIELIDDAPDLDEIDYKSNFWLISESPIRALLNKGILWRDLHEKFDSILIPQAWDADLLNEREVLKTYHKKWWRWLSRDFWSAKSSLKKLAYNDIGTATHLEIAESILEEQQIREEIWRGKACLLSPLFSSHIKGAMDTSWEELLGTAEWCFKAHQEIELRRAHPQLFDSVGNTKRNHDDFKKTICRAKKAFEAYKDRLDQFFELLQFRGSFKLDFQGNSFDNQMQRLQTWQQNLEVVNEIADYNIKGDALVEYGLKNLLTIAEGWPEACHNLADILRYERFLSLAEHAMLTRPALRRFNIEDHSHLVDRFIQLDELLIKENRAKIAKTHWDRLPRNSGAGQLGILLKEFQKRARHLPIRKLLMKAGNVIQAIKPVFMMSPLSVATFVSPISISFDLVIFDEASQVRPVDAFGAILRGKQTVVVGDSKQLPPTRFFDQLLESEEEIEESATENLESILGLFLAQGCQEKMLRWHYRSQHESLIHVSNFQFYNNKLVVFPCPLSRSNDLGLRYHLLSDTVYEAGYGRAYNKGEAKVIADAVMKHAQHHPDLSLGVAAFSQAQSQVIQDHLEILRRQDPSCEEFFGSHSAEPFFVKNLENVQGDERDVILISVGYGKRADGIISMNFGPVNRDGGERRLNVLITRARRRCEVFTNLTSDDINLQKTQAEGVVALKRFLKYAQSGDLDVPITNDRSFESPFEEAVYEELIKLGYQVETQVGTAGFFIDLAIRDPENPSNFLLGVECDGATYHNNRWARDRDRLRQQVLEKQGWHIHRIWSTEWFRSSEKEKHRLVEAINRAMAEKTFTPPPMDTEPPNKFERDEQPFNSDPTTSRKLYTTSLLNISLGNMELHEVSRTQLGQWIKAVVEEESPVHIDEVAHRITKAVGLKRVGIRIRTAIGSAARYLERNGEIKLKSRFCWHPEMKNPTVRDRSKLPNSSKKIELIAPEEIGEALLQVVRDSFGIEAEVASQQAGHLFGFSRVTADMQACINEIRQNLLDEGHLRENNGNLVIP